METVFILQSTFATVQAICSWIEQSQAKQGKLRQLRQTVQSLTMVLEPLQHSFQSGTLDKTLVALLYDAAEILNGIKEHLALWSGKAKKLKLATAITLLSPSVALGMLYDDEKRLAQWINLFTLSLQIATLKEQAGKQTAAAGAGPKLTLGVSWISRNDDVSSFWLESFGEESVFVPSSDFVDAVQKWIGEELDETIRNALLLELDRQSIGGVTRRALDGFTGTRALKESVQDLRSQSAIGDGSVSSGSPSTTESSLSPVSSSSSMSLEPTLVWVDDKMENNTFEVRIASSLEIRVIQLPSTAVAKLWIEQNETELRMLENQGLIQYITDNARWEAVSLSKGSVGGLSLNLSAGETILRYLRGRNLKAPVLVYCGGSIPFTAYVKEFSLAASTCEFKVCRAFMAQLVSAQEAVSEEEGFWSSWALGKGFNLLM